MIFRLARRCVNQVSTAGRPLIPASIAIPSCYRHHSTKAPRPFPLVQVATTAPIAGSSPSVAAVKMAGSSEIIDLHSLANRGSSQLDAQLLDIFDKAINASTPTELSAEATAGELDKLFPGAEDAENYLWSMWTLFERVAKKVPARDPRQQLLVSIVGKLKAKDRETIQLWGNDSKVWSELPMLGPTMREAYDTRPALDGTGQDASSIAEWVSLSSFAARIFGASIQPWDNFAIWELRSALEESPSSSSSTARDANLASASEWFIHAGKVMYDLCRNPKELSEMDTRSLKTGPLLDAKSGFSEERWKFWTEKLAELASQTEAKVLKERAEEALEAIRALEK